MALITRELNNIGAPLYAPDGTMGKAEYGVDYGNAYDHLDLTDPVHQGTFASERVDGLGRTVEKITRHRECSGSGFDTDECESASGVVERWGTVEYDALGNPLTVTRSEVPAGADPGSAEVKISRRAAYDSLGRMRVNLDLTFGRWEYAYDDLGQIVETTNPLGQTADYYYDLAGRLTHEYYEDQLEAQYLYDAPPSESALWGAETPQEWPGYPASLPGGGRVVTIGRLVAVRDRSGVSVSAGDYGSFSESWKQIYPSERLYHFETSLNYRGELIYSEDPDGHRSTADYYESGALRRTYWNGTPIVTETEYNYMGQTELVEYGDGARTVA